jgi:hypothetical protein
MAKYSVFVTGRLSKTFEIEADTKEDAMINALEYFNSIATKDYTEGDVVSEVYTDADEIPSEEVKEENTTEE